MTEMMELVGGDIETAVITIKENINILVRDRYFSLANK